MIRRLHRWGLILATALWLALAVPAWAAIAFDAASQANDSTPTTPWTLTWSHTCTAGSNTALFVTAWANGSNDANMVVTGITYNGVALTKVDAVPWSQGADQRAELWRLVAPATGAAHDIVITWTGSISEQFGAAVSLTGVDQTTPVEAQTTYSTGASLELSWTKSLLTISDNAWLIDGGGGNYGTTPYSPSVATQRAYVQNSPKFCGMSSRGPISPPASTSMGWTASGSTAVYTAVIAAIKPASAGGTKLTITGATTLSTGVTVQ